jgi:hypothetical protein
MQNTKRRYVFAIATKYKALMQMYAQTERRTGAPRGMLYSIFKTSKARYTYTRK